ncbi:hypothetical protein [Winogradskyella sp. PG-2]|uniref:hypothetical protein n=1 Tax=Winogradskyella sp. PG-2 TaxID=754409 RepID=UPI0004589107|nr:hypothetical protein [Winogradskyella sp. PG-2]BAO77044.1 hypothetical protein WPG_2814 [Winogradskyella sp. PG-2]
MLRDYFKEFRYIDSNGNNVLFGSEAIYNPDSIIITSGSNEIIDYDKQEDTGVIVFDLENGGTSYQITLSNVLIDALEFELAERKSELCCGNVTFSNKTILNGQEIENSDLIVITIN